MASRYDAPGFENAAWRASAAGAGANVAAVHCASCAARPASSGAPPSRRRSDQSEAHRTVDGPAHRIDGRVDRGLRREQPETLDCAEAPYLLENAAVRIGNFASAVGVQELGGNRLRLLVHDYVAQRVLGPVELGPVTVAAHP